MTTIIIATIVIFIIGFFVVKSYRTLNNIQDDATTLVAYIKYAGKGKSSIFDKEKNDEDFLKEKYEKLMKTCFLLVKFSKQVQGKPTNYRFQILENGPQFGEYITVNLGFFMDKVTEATNQIINSMPSSYRTSLDNFMSNPYSPENISKMNDLNEQMFPTEKHLKIWSSQLHESIINGDYLYILCSTK